MAMRRILYQRMTQPPLPENLQPEAVLESKWHYPWSEPVRFKKGTPAYLQRAFTGDPNPFPTSKNMGWYQWWSEPKRFKKGLGAHLAQVDPYQVPIQPLVSSFIQWYAPLSEPVRIKPGTKAANQAFFFYEPEFPEDMDVDWFDWWSEPKRFPKGLGAHLQQSFAYHPRILPTPDVTATMAVTEVNTDVFLGGINVYSSATPATSGRGAIVSIVETGPGGDPVSIREG